MKMEKLNLQGHTLFLEPTEKTVYMQFDGGEILRIAQRTFLDFLRLYDKGLHIPLLKKVKRIVSYNKCVKH